MSYRRISAVIAVLALVVSIPMLASARKERLTQIPNNNFGCAACHTKASGGGARNAFGKQVGNNLTDAPAPAQQEVQWSQIYDMDADGDGYTNGQELGDPMGEWRIGDDNPDATPTHPSKESETPCGNGMVQYDEQCDGDDLAGETCMSQGEEAGTLSCTASCEFDTSQCGATEGDAGMSEDAGESEDTGMSQDTGTFSDLGNDQLTDSGQGATDDMEESGCTAAGDGAPLGPVAGVLFLIGLGWVRRQ
jgi:hypothetical protein